MVTVTTPTFSEVSTTSFGYVEIETLVHVGIISGYNQASQCSNGATPCFLPNNNTRRGEISKIAERAITTAP